MRPLLPILFLAVAGCATQNTQVSPLTGPLVASDRGYVSAQLVTVYQFAQFVANTGYQARGCEVWDGHSWTFHDGLSWANPGFQQSPDHPVVCISRSDANAYINWLNAVLNPPTPYRLIQSNEWDMLVATRPTAVSKGRVNCAETRCRDGFRHTSPVGAFAPSKGLYDVQGNAYTLTGDIDEQGRVVTRGSSWRTSSREFLDPMFRNSIAPNERSNIVGFRIAQDPLVSYPDNNPALAQH